MSVHEGRGNAFRSGNEDNKRVVEGFIKEEISLGDRKLKDL